MSVVEINGSVINGMLIVQGTVVNSMLIVEDTHETEITSMYYHRMNDYYPQVIQVIQEFQAILKGEDPEFESLNGEVSTLADDAYLTSMSEERILQWEQILGIQPADDSSVEDRRDTIIARIRGQGKLNQALIASIVNAFTGGSATSWIENSKLYVVITPPPDNKQYKFANVEQELKKKIPAHLGLKVSRNYYTWGQANAKYSTWGDLKAAVDTWEDIYLYVPFSQTS